MSKRQSVTATSTTEAEYVAIYHCVHEAIVLKRLLTELSAWDTNSPMTLMSDSQSAIALTMNGSTNHESIMKP